MSYKRIFPVIGESFATVRRKFSDFIRCYFCSLNESVDACILSIPEWYGIYIS
ncbi:hypothetical protein GCWU000325_02214 [Alloprevotella tannerae ATCC 51259]|uniref:Uncharacterized protein n=1 Tax=Alloprevotella tannerae ATCC 51259 TaxID=626522 RepID=C9LJ02_9BACT|nr:hypothetical protein GCWU000325_02214 [Alloprevotella tannerae ATCC 51259]